jgi:hypothetical protein
LGAGLELTTVLLGHPFDVLFALPVVTVVAVVAVGNGELPVEPEPDPGMAPQATSMKVSPITSETAGKKNLRFSMCTVRIRVTPYITIFLTSCTYRSMHMMSACNI